MLGISTSDLAINDENKYTVLILELLDLIKTFEVADYKILLHKLCHCGIKGYAHTFFLFLSNRM